MNISNRIKTSGRYYSVSLNVDFLKAVDKHIQNKPQYRSRADFVRVAVINQLNYEKKLYSKEEKVV